MYLERTIEKDILAHLNPKRAVIIYGPRQTGKTTLLEKLRERLKNKKIYWINGEDRNVREWMSSEQIDTLKNFLGDTEVLMVDEAQLINKIGINLKLIVDHIPKVQVIATGSSSFELANQVGEPLVGRKWQYILYPFAQMELKKIETLADTKSRLAERLIFGGYPQIIFAKGFDEKKSILESIVDNYLFRDILVMEEIRKSEKLVNLLRLVAFQIGKEVSLRELGAQLGINVSTIERYLDILEKTFVVKRVYGFSRNLRKEISKTSRFYFYDNGVRNALINNFNVLESRDDVGQLWENYLFIERMKKQHYQKIYANNYFWRTYDQKEIDLVEERDGKLYGYEFKWGLKKKRPPALWLKTYKNAEYQVIDRENYLNFIT